MQIIFSPIVRSPGTDYELVSLSVKGEVLAINGIEYDLTTLKTDPDNDMIIGGGYIQSATQVDGEWTVTLLLPIGDNASGAQRFPDPVTVASGPVPLPAPPAPEPEETSTEDAG
ncbi:hypothetical protein [Thioclava sp. GXIMD2076]|uniref:hypothetical protein n=1 Tax=Thioclava sp. GXIMD2076 TaxID=3131931 RepID=UPI0030CC6195